MHSALFQFICALFMLQAFSFVILTSTVPLLKAKVVRTNSKIRWWQVSEDYNGIILLKYIFFILSTYQILNLNKMNDKHIIVVHQ